MAKTYLSGVFLLSAALSACSGGMEMPGDVPTDRRTPASDADASTGEDVVNDLGAEDVPTVDTGIGDTGIADTGVVTDSGVFVSDVTFRDGGRLLLPRCEDTEPGGPNDLMPVPSTLLGTVVPEAIRVSVANPLTNPSSESGERDYRMRGLDRYRRGAGENRVVRRDFGGSTATPAMRGSLAYFVQISDFQLTDDESPTRLAATDNPLIGAGNRPQEAYIPRVMSAVNRTLASLERRSMRPFDFGVFAGDCADSGQLNELRWFIEVMDGHRGVHFDSGADDDPVPGPNNDPKDPFDAVAFPAPWMYVPGNHDVMITGLSVPDTGNRATAAGDNSVGGTRDYSQYYAPVVRGRVAPDPNRRPLERAEIVRELFTHSTSGEGPVGHGYPATPDLRFGAHYTRDLIPGVLRLIGFDTSDPTGGSKGLIRRSVVDGFLRPELERGTRDGVLMMMVSHHPLDSIDRQNGEIGLPVSDAVSEDDLRNLIVGFPNMFMWMVGHQHMVRIRAIRGPDAARPGFWEVQSGSIADWPSQGRIVELVANDNGTLSIFGTMIDYDTMDCMERRFRRLTLMDFMSGWAGEHRGTAQDRNVELVLPIPPAARAAVTRAMMGASRRIESESTLRGM
jgi:hypothetical protein